MKYLKYLVIPILFSILISAQPKASFSSSEILQGLKKLNQLGSVLYIAAHPDDENTSLLAYFAKGKLFRTGYLSLTRGDGGQNLIGPEQSELLGVIRTQELLEARKRDGAEQFFSRAIDFGYSKSPEETFTKWDKQKVLYDVVWVIRTFKPDVIITRFPTTGEGRHGHHTASAILALEGFRMAGDKNAFPDQLNFTDTWQPKRIYWNAWMPILESKGVNPESLPSINLGEYNSLLGKSYTEISAISRSMHKSQGFGSSGNRTNNYNYFELMDGSPSSKDLFEGVDVSWNRVEGGKKVGDLISEVIEKFDPENPAAIIPELITIKKHIQSLSDSYWKNLKLSEVNELIKNCAGIWIEAIASSEVVSIGDTLKINSMIVNRSDYPFQISLVELVGTGLVKSENLILNKGEANSTEFTFNVPPDFSYTQKFWLANKHEAGMYNFDGQNEIGKADSDPSLSVKFILKSDAELLEFTTPVFFRYTDPVKGEVYKSLIIAPPTTINFDKEIYYFKNGEEKELRLSVTANQNNLNGTLNLNAENGWEIVPDKFVVNIDQKGEQQIFPVKVFPGKDENTSMLSASINVGGKKYANSKTKFEYDHILTQTVFHPSEAKLVALNYESAGVKKIGYISGSGDVIPDFLKDLGYEISLLNDEDISANNLKLYDVIITGIRAFNTRDKLKSFRNELNEYVNQGGVLISQYNTTGDLIAEPGPFMLNISRDRVTDENAAVKILDQSNPVINFPFRITQANFENWIQERGLYYADKWDNVFVPLFEMNDPGETPKQGSLLFARYGKGVFIYTGLSFFRQIPAGVTGAIKLFINMLYTGVYEKQN